MIYTFQLINSTKKVLFFAKNEEEALAEIKYRYGGDRKFYSLVSFGFLLNAEEEIRKY